ncbi:hypothetical protein [uncultured Mucilaginibacter sp.]|uniref:hypothetical protein n=1 Tax=uncultured Mucilaginibacter sp. TaxID=797541 RepID=UPI0025CF41E7|nr:hypothetical protein [uncultured Mucilaginibacter sp.]
MKKIISTLLLFAAPVFLMAQTISLTGSVRDQHGIPVVYAFILDQQQRNATFTDSLGNFNLKVEPTSQLNINCNGYQDDSLQVGGKNHLEIVLKQNPVSISGGEKLKNKDLDILQEAFKTNSSQLLGGHLNGIGAMVYTETRETVGSRFLFNQWVHGYVIKNDGSLVQMKEVTFNYDKMAGDLYLAVTNASVMLADKNVIKSFSVFSPKGQLMTFELVSQVSKDFYLQVISAGSKYKIYKLFITKFVPSNYKSDGVVSSGNTYDEYTDEYAYFIWNLSANTLAVLNTRKKDVKAAFAAEGSKLTDYMTAHNNKIDENYIKGLADAMNQ